LANSTEWSANLTRHPAKSQNYTFCANCHNTTNATTFHAQPLRVVYSIHGGVGTGGGFDWENDDWNETGVPNPDPENESCYACHLNNTFIVPQIRLCENCHLPDKSQNFTGPFRTTLDSDPYKFNLRPDINDTLPRVYAHTNYSEASKVTIPAQNGGSGSYPTTCYSYNKITGEGTCHAAPYFNRSNFGSYYSQWADSSGPLDNSDPGHWTQTIDRMPATSDCLFCHNQGNATIRRGWGNATLVTNVTMFGNRYDASKNQSCYTCHTRNGTQPVDFHSDEVVEGGGPGCLACHNSSTPQNFTDKNGSKLRYIDGANFSLSVHANMNRGNATVNGINYSVNASCWACHNSSGYAIANNTHPDKRDTPYVCTDCHLASGSKAGAYNATIVEEHFINGSQIRTSNATNNVTSCMGCHNKTEMLVSNNDTDSGSFDADSDGTKGGNRSVYHYGKNRTDLRTAGGTATNCSYCHQNPNTNFTTAMANPGYNASISNHSTYASNPGCTNSTCHNSGWLHNSTLTKPTLTLPNSSFCLACHGDNGSGGTNYTNATTGIKQRHNGTSPTALNCTQCHLNDSRSIHPVRYLQQDGSNFSTSITNAVNCTNCHQVKLQNFSTAPIIPDPLKHSANLSNGSLWNSTPTPYWTSETGACYYCHNNTKHNATALGKISGLLSDPANIKNGSTTLTTWCADCHYNNSANTYYNGTKWSPVPPLITINNTGKSRWENHSTYFGGGYNDSVCQACHALNGLYASTSLNLSHSLNEGVVGDPNCILCHNLATGLSGGASVGVNFTAANLSVHNGTNSINATNRGFAPVVGACWACHDTDGNVTSGHPDKYKTPKTCVDCHLANGTYYNQSAGWGGLTVTEHYYSGNQIIAGNSSSNISSCINCHENVSEMIVYNNDTNYGSFTGDGVRLTGGNLSFYHYGANRSDIRIGATANCSYCHRNTSTAFNISMLDKAYSSNVSNHSTSYSSSNPGCSQCHNTGWLHNSTLTKPNLTLPNSTFCTSCHGTPGNSSTTIKNLSQHNGTTGLNCTQCHLNTSRSIHPVRYLQQDGSNFSTSITNAVNCTNCHQVKLQNFSTAPIIPDPLKHSANLSNGSLWNSTPTPYWTSETGACYYCHNNTKHNATALGKISGLLSDPANIKNGSTTLTTWCADCHYNN
ncbi:MAG: hypothetical protein WC749_14890, partial [Dehalococcoidia bacterium]